MNFVIGTFLVRIPFNQKKMTHVKNIFLAVIMLGIFTSNLIAQDVNSQLNEARSSYTSGNLQDARFALQQALNEIDMAIGAEILKVLPAAMGELPMVETEDNVATAGYVGLFVSRSYHTGDVSQTASINIITDSPLLSGINALLALPAFMGDKDQKRIRVGGYRGILQKNESEEGSVSWDLQIPMGSTLLTFNCNGFDNESTVMDMVNNINVEEIGKLVR